MTIRQCKIYGEVAVGTSATITMNSATVFSGVLTAVGLYMAEFSVDIDDALAINNDITVPTTINVTAGSCKIGLAEWNYTWITNPVYTSEQISTLQNPATTQADQVAIYSSVANPPFSPADEEVLLSTDPADATARTALINSHNASVYLQSASEFTTSPLNPAEATCNRANVLIDGVAVSGSDTNNLLEMTAGQVMTLDNIVFASNSYPTAS